MDTQEVYSFIVGITVELIYLKVYMLTMGEVTLKGYKCERCGHVWLPKEQGAPKVCPHCKSPYWDRPRRTQLDFKEKRRLR